MNDELMLALGRLEGKVDSLISRQTILDEEMRKFDSRLRSVEQSRSWLVGAAASVGALVAIGIQWITKD
tara:strand:+ start:6073 stop:6279 length:207 start_codon:yes stop_codon:yes gene_type:complete